MAQISLQNSAGKVVFYGWVPRNPPLGTNGSKSTLVTEVLTKYILLKFGPNTTPLTMTLISVKPGSSSTQFPQSQQWSNINQFATITCHTIRKHPNSCLCFATCHVEFMTCEYYCTLVYPQDSLQNVLILGHGQKHFKAFY